MKLLNKGFSVMEVVIAAGATALLGLGTSQLVTKQNDANKELLQRKIIRQVTKEIQGMVNRKDICERPAVLGVGGGANNNIVLNFGGNNYAANRNLDHGVQIRGIRSTTIVGSDIKKEVEVTIDFRRRLLLKTVDESRSFTVSVVVNDGNVQCRNYEKNNIYDDSMQKSCESAGGQWSSALSRCRFDAATFAGSDFEVRLKTILCETLRGTRNPAADKCDQIDISGFITSRNLKQNEICLNNGNDCRTQFDSSNCGGNQFVNRFSQAGERSCGNVQFPFN